MEETMPQGPDHSPVPFWVSTRIDDEAIEYYRSVGEFTPAEDREPLTVDLVQRDDLSPDGDPAGVRHNPAQIRMAGIRLDPDEVNQLVWLLRSAVAMTRPPQQPERRWRSYRGGYGLAPISSATRGHRHERSA
jgi:hypothetical protein